MGAGAMLQTRAKKQGTAKRKEIMFEIMEGDTDETFRFMRQVLGASGVRDTGFGFGGAGTYSLSLLGRCGFETLTQNPCP